MSDIPEWAVEIVDSYGLADDKTTNETRRLKIARALASTAERVERETLEDAINAVSNIIGSKPDWTQKAIDAINSFPASEAAWSAAKNMNKYALDVIRTFPLKYAMGETN